MKSMVSEQETPFSLFVAKQIYVMNSQPYDIIGKTKGRRRAKKRRNPDPPYPPSLYQKRDRGRRSPFQRDS